MSPSLQDPYRAIRDLLGEGGFGTLSAIEDLHMFADLHAEWGDEANGLYPDDPPNLTASDNERLAAAFTIGRRMDALLRAAIVFGDLAGGLLLQEVLRQSREVNVKFLSSPNAPRQLREWASSLDSKPFRSAHALRVFRSQILLHHSQGRMGAVVGKAGDFRARRLMPIHFAGATDEAIQSLEQVMHRHSHLPDVANVREIEPNRHNFWEMLDVLFYSLDPLLGREPNSDRIYVDRLAVHGGVKSPTMSEVVETVTAFSATVLEHMPAPDLARE